ncbi:IS66 family insertion sequence element accessory protein TnpA [Parapedobacter tibetensis]|uniref:IS66 family insertion sequence element accessory protein TnpA n=1 Tax=Parapedobacter tibetensis TaxID=2972951 RepID=UPI00214D1688|nr:IS66 family insertion sequence element accessory protein TnpB [Parapedobacter tibetensis]
MSTLASKRAHMLSLVEQWRTSGQTQKAFCQFQGIRPGTLAYWVRISKEDHGPSGFVEVFPKNNPIQKIEVIYPNGVKVNAGTDLALVSRLIHLY